TVEAHEALAKIVDGASAYYHADHYDSCGSVTPKAFPGIAMPRPNGCGTVDGTGDYVPSKTCSSYPGFKCPGIDVSGVNEFDASPDSSPWRCLRFAISSSHYYAYSFQGKGSEAKSTFTAIACWDNNHDAPMSLGPGSACDDPKLSKLKRSGYVNPD